MKYKVREDVAKPLESVWFWVIIGLVWVDLSITFTGIKYGVGGEGNPFYSPFVEYGEPAMVIGVAIYTLILLVWFRYTPPVLRAISVGVLVSAHTWGIMSWLRNWIPEFNFFFGTFIMIVIPPLLGSVLTIWVFLEPDEFSLGQTDDRITWVNES